jgi:flagellar basal-body rod modification protein FlgD
MSINGINSQGAGFQALSFPTPNGSTNGTTGTKKPEEKNMFMSLLVAQLKNQDPLAPQDSTQFVAQLAQFNSLEQLISINQRLGEVLGSPSEATNRVSTIK